MTLSWSLSQGAMEWQVPGRSRAHGVVPLLLLGVTRVRLATGRCNYLGWVAGCASPRSRRKQYERRRFSLAPAAICQRHAQPYSLGVKQTMRPTSRESRPEACRRLQRMHQRHFTLDAATMQHINSFLKTSRAASA
jgi:hypothetical protein